jgi:hypothetical protein
MSRTTPSLARAAAAAFDFDVVTDAPAIPARRPEAAKPAPGAPDKPRAAEAEAAESR